MINSSVSQISISVLGFVGLVLGLGIVVYLVHDCILHSIHIPGYSLWFLVPIVVVSLYILLFWEFFFFFVMIMTKSDSAQH